MVFLELTVLKKKAGVYQNWTSRKEVNYLYRAQFGAPRFLLICQKILGEVAAGRGEFLFSLVQFRSISKW